jgi:Ca-activated chloride channel homolog
VKCFLTICLMLVFAAYAGAQTQSPHLRSANRKYKESKYDEAVPEYLEAKETDPNNPVVNFNLGNAFFRNNRFDGATGAFDAVIASESDDELRQKAYYNKGVSLTKQSKLEESIEAYKMAVMMNPADEDARINLQKALLELKKKMPPPPEKKEEKQKKQEQKDKQKQPPQSNLTKKQVEQLLKALQQREQQVQQKMQQRQRTAGQQEKDW